MSVDQSQLNSIQGTKEVATSQGIDVSSPIEIGQNKSDLSKLSGQVEQVRNGDKSGKSREQSDLKANSSDIASLSSKLAGATTKVNGARQNFQNATASVTNQRNITGTSKANMESLYTQFTEAQAAEPGSEKAVKLEFLYKSAEGKLNDEESRLQTLEESLGDAKDELESAKNDVSNLTSELVETNSAQSSFSRKLSSPTLSSSTARAFSVPIDSSSPKSSGGTRGASKKRGASSGPKSPAEVAKEIEEFLKGLAKGSGTSTSSGNAYLDGAKTILGAIQGIYQRGISTNAFINKAKNYTVKTLAQAGKSMAEAGMASQVTSTSEAAFQLRTVLARLQGFSGLAEESQQYWNDIAKTNFSKGVGVGSDQISA